MKEIERRQQKKKGQRDGGNKKDEDKGDDYNGIGGNEHVIGGKKGGDERDRKDGDSERENERGMEGKIIKYLTNLIFYVQTFSEKLGKLF